MDSDVFTNKTLFSILFLLFVPLLQAQEPAPAAPSKPKVVYHGFDPDIVTNFVSDGQKSLGYVRVTMELMIKDEKYLSMIEHHEPLILDAIVGVFGKEPDTAIKSLQGREEIRIKILKKINELMKKETGNELVQDVLFTKYLYQ